MAGDRKINDLSIHSFNDNDYSRLVELSQTTYPGREISNAEYLSWQYLDNPDGKAIMTVAEQDERIISQYVVLPRMFSIQDELVSGSLSVNTLTHPEFRSHGLFTRLSEETFKKCSEKNIRFTIGFPNSISHPIIEKENIFETKGHLSLLVNFISPWKTLRNYLSSPKIKSGDEINLNLLRENFPDQVSEFDFSIDEAKYEDFLVKIRSEKKNTTHRSLKFLKWRYKDIPIRKYLLLKLEVAGKIVAFAVMRAKHVYGIRCGILVDFLALDGNKNASEIIHCIKRIARANKLNLIFTTVPAGSFESKILKPVNFICIPNSFLPQKLSFILRIHLQNVSEDISDFKKWFLTFGDYDIF